MCEVIDFAFQSISDFQTGEIYGYEALLRDYHKAGFDSIDAFFDAAYQSGMLVEVEHCLRKKAIKKFKSLKLSSSVKLFLNIDNRVLSMPNYHSGETAKYLKEENISLNTIIFELSEKHHIHESIHIDALIENYSDQGFSIAIDDFGTGYSGLQILYTFQPRIIKVDRFFIKDIGKEHAKRVLAKHLINFAKEMHITLLAEGVETEEEFNTCKALGFDLIQGFYIDKPITRLEDLATNRNDVWYQTQIFTLQKVRSSSA